MKMNNRWKFQCRTVDNKMYIAVHNLYLSLMLAGEFIWSIVFVLLLRNNEESDCIKIFDSYSSWITAVSNILKQTKM